MFFVSTTKKTSKHLSVFTFRYGTLDTLIYYDNLELHMQKNK